MVLDVLQINNYVLLIWEQLQPVLNILDQMESVKVQMLQQIVHVKQNNVIMQGTLIHLMTIAQIINKIV